MPLIEESEAIARLQAHLPAVRDIVVGGWNDYITGYPDEKRVIHTPTTRANIIHDHQVERASRYCQLAHGARLEDLSRMKVLVLEDAFAIRFKKLDDVMRSANQPTLQVADFRAQAQLPGLPETYNLEAGYVLRQFDEGIAGTYLVCPNGPQFYWAAELTDGAGNQTVFSIRDPKRPDGGSEEATGVVVRPKQSGIIVPLRRGGDEG